MPNSTPSSGRVDTAARIIYASPEVVYQAFLSSEAIAAWLPPEGMSGHVYKFEPRPGGVYEMALIHQDSQYIGKTSDSTDRIRGNFAEFIPAERIVQNVMFDSDDPGFAGEMKMTWQLEAATEGTKVTITCENVPAGVRKEDHDVGLNSTLAKLAAYTEGKSIS